MSSLIFFLLQKSWTLSPEFLYKEMISKFMVVIVGLTTRLYLLQDLRCAWSIDSADTFQNSHRLFYYTVNGRLQIHGYSSSIRVSCRNKHFCTQIKKAYKYASRILNNSYREQIALSVIYNQYYIL